MLTTWLIRLGKIETLIRVDGLDCCIVCGIKHSPWTDTKLVYCKVADDLKCEKCLKETSD